MSRIAEHRITVYRSLMFHWLGAIEVDLRDAIRAHLAFDDAALWPEGLEDKARRICDKELGDPAGREASKDELVDYLDLGDSLQLLNRHRQKLPEPVTTELARTQERISSVIPARNRVMHNRPLDPGDYPQLEQLVELLCEAELHWQNLRGIQQRLELDPSVLFDLPRLVDTAESYVENNLPAPEFDDTGFVGRSDDVRAVHELLATPYPVISILGEGGLGKTALARKIADDVVFDPATPYDLVLWTTAKRNRLTSQDIVAISDSVSDSASLLADVLTDFGDFDDPADGLLEVLQTFSVFLVLDNVETVSDHYLDTFLKRIPHGTKILLTSRVGVGGDQRHGLSAMTSGDATNLLRKYSKAKNVERLGQMANADLQRHCHEMKNNPLFIRWFVQSVASGRRPEDVLANPEMLLDFCMGDVFGNLGSDALKLCQALISVPELERYSTTQISSISGRSPTDVEMILRDLQRTSVVEFEPAHSKGGPYRTLILLSEIAKQYLLKRHRPSSNEYSVYRDNFLRMKRELATRDVTPGNARSHYKFSEINAESDDERLLRPRLKQIANTIIKAQQNSSQTDLTRALEEVESVLSLHPDWPEARRIKGSILSMLQDPLGARIEYDHAIEFAPNRPALRYFYANFLKNDGDYTGAAEQLEMGLTNAPNDPELLLELGLIEMYLKDYDSASNRFKNLLIRLDDLTPFRRRKLVDQWLQVPIRLADDFLSTGDEEKALEQLELLEERYAEADPDLVDDTTVRKLAKAERLAGQLERNSAIYSVREAASRIRGRLSREAATLRRPPSSESAQIDLGKNEKATGSTYCQVGDWEVGSVHEGVFVGHHPQFSTGGFIEVNNRRIFVHRNNMANLWDWRSLSEGSIVSFRVGLNNKGQCADDVRPAVG